MILNTGTRTDIPAFFHKWFLNRIEEGFVLSKNPYNNQIYKYNFNPKTVVLPYYQNSSFFGDKNPRYVVRVATGAKLSSTGKYPDNTKAIPGVTDVYRYYRDIEKPADGKPEKTENIIEL
jgi:hypothetical protein